MSIYVVWNSVHPSSWTESEPALLRKICHSQLGSVHLHYLKQHAKPSQPGSVHYRKHSFSNTQSLHLLNYLVCMYD